VSNVPAAQWKVDLALAGVACVWGTTFVLVKAALAYASTLAFLGLRFSLATLVLAWVFRQYWQRRRLPGKWAGFQAGSCLFLGYLFQTLGLRLTTPARSAFLTGSSVVLVPLLVAVLFRRAPRWFEVVGAITAFSGVALLSWEPACTSLSPGDLLTLAGALFFALQIVVVGHYAGPVGFEPLVLLQMVTVTVWCAATFWWAEEPRLGWSAVLAAAVAITGVLATAVAFGIQAWAQQRTSATRTALIFSTEPLFAWAASFLVTGERLHLRGIMGGALILTGILVVELMAGSGRPRSDKTAR